MRRVLLVEDNESTIDVVEMELKCLGYEVTIARDGLEALDRVTEQSPDLVIMDIHLPKMNGFEAVRRIRAIPAVHDIPILAATAKALNGDQERCLAAGCDGYIAKPFTHRELEVAINGTMKRRLSALQLDEK
ncbi:MAG TPA: response regulator [Candidatus Binatia bacterium]|jgi:CheY-like chemotaxis protein